ncbi:MAG TPA: class I SAM-dependent methyltransferase [Solirubrobacteraceae bacterium]|nr:class I SAM-dependent methyltransferase [Solirubrobacteraceae bacterium]
MTSVTRSADGVVTGNTYDKYNTSNPIAKALQSGFERNLDDLFRSVSPASLLDVGCGEGVLTQSWAKLIEPARVVGIDLDDPLIAAEWASRPAANLTYMAQRTQDVPWPFEDGEFDIVTAIEVLEHVPDPAATVAEMARCAARHLLISVPREPLWRAVNMARGAYLRELGNTPGHVNHFSKSAITSLCARHGEVIETRSPFPWTMVLVHV